MHTNRGVLIALVFGVGVGIALGQPSGSPDEISELRKTVEGLAWKEVDFAGAGLLERCRALMLLNHTLKEIGSLTFAEEDLMRVFVDKAGLGEKAGSGPAADPPIAQSFLDAKKIALALLRGPMSKSVYTKELASMDDHGLEAYEKLYDRTCQKKWGEFSGSRDYVNQTAGHLQSENQMTAYMAWAKTESSRRQEEYEKEMAGRRAAVGAQARAEEEEAKAEFARLDQERHAEAEQSREALRVFYADSLMAAADAQEDRWYTGYALLHNDRPRPWYRAGTYQRRPYVRRR